MSLTLTLIDDLTQLNTACWSQFIDYPPWLSQIWLGALESSGSVGGQTGWQPNHVLVHQHGRMVGLLPGYIKQHSYGEYVFDHAWAEAFHRHGVPYYPKWINAIPFTPISGPKMLLAPGIEPQRVRAQLAQQQRDLWPNISSLHCLFTEPERPHETSPWLSRQSVQYCWHQRAYRDWQDYLDSMVARRRKRIRKEREQLQTTEQITIRRLSGSDITAVERDYFYTCYRHTYLKRSGHEGYLREAFFQTIFAAMPDNLLLVIAYQGEQPVACSFFVFDQHMLAGRYWGATYDIPGLHFECCYYQGIEFALERGIAKFNPGTQGEHKILRGFDPELGYSQHLIRHPQFHSAIEDFLVRERAAVADYLIDCQQLLPFKREQ